MRSDSAPDGERGLASESDPDSLTLTGLLARQVELCPDAPAVLCGGERLSYRELDERANRLARELIARGIGPEHLVAVALKQSVALLVALLGVLKSGAAYVPVDPAYPAARLEQVLRDAEPALLLTVAPIVGALPGISSPVLLLDSVATERALADRSAAPVRDAERLWPLRPQHPVYIIYTSGSTGRPKGVVLCHASVVNYLTWAARSYAGTGGVALVQSSFAFDLTVTGLFAPLLAGGLVHLAGGHGGGRAGLREHPATFLKATPGHIPLLNLLPAEFSPRRELVVGGEQLLGAALAEWRSRHPEATVVNEYGPTEATVGCMEYRIEPGDDLPPGPVPIGTAIDGVRIHVLDSRLRPVDGPEAEGELYVSGAALARGYFGRPDLTAERFLPCPAGPSGERMYRTGDLVRIAEDGALRYVGRTDRQVKVRGFRIEPAEVETALLGHPAVAQAAVFVQPGESDAPGGRLAACVVLRTGRVEQSEQIRAHLGARLPAFMVPTNLTVLSEIPLTPSGKVDRDALTGLNFGTGQAPSALP
ncbi:amino acid adenylation domain-containing protein [Streptomyces sp. NPDC005303]|uniref:amino acid adenylation domain-containing protein n=1 Tax=Streptomyces sp. NPDC005303 TaxID=3155713 RepID=UPI0033B72229